MEDVAVTISNTLERHEKAAYVLRQIPIVGPLIAYAEVRAQDLRVSRLEGFADYLQELINKLDSAKLDADYLESEHFFEILQITIGAVQRASNEKKRKTAAHFIAGVIAHGEAEELSMRFANDFLFLDALHFKVLAALPRGPNSGLWKHQPPESISDMDMGLFTKAFTDIERFGFITFDNSGIGTFGGGGGHWFTTEYFQAYLKYVNPPALEE